ncbi:MAG: thermonuclease family protein [Betaproteobacteria bacterium]|nr:thermonuclease family protein [Betaproteobacteria bacterium]
MSPDASSASPTATRWPCSTAPARCACGCGDRRARAKQPWSSRSRDALAARAMHRDALVATRGTDGYGRTLARVAVDGVDLGEAQLRDGLAWVYRRYTKDRAMIAIEDEARAARRGLWSLPDPEPPWAWRAREARASPSSPPAQRGVPKASPSGSLPGNVPK